MEKKFILTEEIKRNAPLGNEDELEDDLKLEPITRENFMKELMDKRMVIGLIGCFEDINFIEQENGDYTIGYIQDHKRTISVDFLEDNHGRYLKLSYSMKLQGDVKILDHKLSQWFKHGRYKIGEQTIELYQIFPILNENLLEMQIKHTLSEIWDMSATVECN